MGKGKRVLIGLVFVFMIIAIIGSVSAASFSGFGSSSSSQFSVVNFVKNLFNTLTNSGGVGNPDTECQNNGFDFGIVKYACGNYTPDDTGSGFDDYDINLDWHGCYQVDWTAIPGVAGVLEKEATETYNHTGGTSGTIYKGFHDISHITFCGNEGGIECHDCLVPDSLNDNISEGIGNLMAEKTLQQFFSEKGYSINTTGDQTNVQVWHATNDAQLEITYWQGISAYRHVFGYYLNGDKNTFTPLFKNAAFIPVNVPLANGGDTFNLTINSGNIVGFAIRVYDINSNIVNTYYTENLLNQYGRDRALVYDLCDEFLIGFEDWIDYDYQDIMFKINRISCGGSEHYCGDGNIDDGEQCDDGNNVTGDGCDNQCQIEQQPYCGDGNIDDGEQCDDGNLIDNDECPTNCIIATCGDGYICSFAGCATGPNNGPEQCDDWADGDDTNLCYDDCSTTYCGDGIVQWPNGEQPFIWEECDDGNQIDNDSCSNSCEINVCVPDTCEILEKVCGSWLDGCGGILNCGPPVTSCSVDYGTCSEDGEMQCGFNGQYDGVCQGTIDPRTPEICDELDNDCNGIIDDGLQCGGEPYCDDGNVDHGEQCDNSTLNGVPCIPEYGEICAYCTSECEIDYTEGGWCDNGVIEEPEECDDGEFNTLNGCSLNVSSYCEYQTCNIIYCGPVCGDGNVDAGEQCDDGNNVTGDGCDNQCQIEICVPDTCESLGKECGYYDDGCGNTLECGDLIRSCSVDYGTCSDEGQEYCVGGDYSGECIGVVDPRTPEICDELDNDCNGLIDDGLQCQGPECGNGILENGEQCDDGNQIDNDSCSNSCEINVCVPKTCESLGYQCGTHDNGCNGTINCGPTQISCSVDYGTCSDYGTKYCNEGQYGSCEGTVDPRTPEICDELDNDCNGLIDDGLQCQSCEDRDSDNDGVNDCDDYCPNSKPNEPVDQNGCDIFQFCGVVACGPGCEQADWKWNEPGVTYPHDCTTVIVENEGQLYPTCVPTEFSNMCAG